MKPITSFALLSALATLASQGAVTDPVGYISLGDTSNPGVDPAVPANTEVTLAVDLLQPVEATATVDSVAGSTITVSDTLVDGAFDAPVSGAPWMVEITSGTEEGLFAVIVSNDTTSITVMLGGGDTLTSVANGDTLSIRKAWTLETLLPAAGLPDQVQLAAYDVQTGINNSASPLFINNSLFGGWIDGSTFGAAGDTVLYPGESFVFINPTVTDIASLTMTGEVPTSLSRIRLYKDGAGAQDTRFSFVSPVGQVLDDAGFSPTDNDQIFVYDQTASGINKSAAQTLIFNPLFGGWIDGSTFTPVGATFEFQGGVGYVYRRTAAAPVGDQIIQAEQAYIPSL